MNQTKYNPYRPGSLVSPGMFAGRVKELIAIEKCLFQTKHGNPRNFLIEGERGIGKSSLAFFIKLLAAGKITWSDGVKLNFLVIDIELSEQTTTLEIVRKIGLKIRQELTSNLEYKTLGKVVLDVISNIKIMGTEYRKSGNFLDPIEAIDDLAQATKDLIVCLKDAIDGILILIDEADKPDPKQAKLGEIIKLFSERLTRIECNSVCFGLSGLPTLVSKLRESHELAPRIFEILPLGVLLRNDRETVIRRGLAEAKSKNEIETEIDDDALGTLVVLSEGYPHFLQEFSYAAFEEDDDNSISRQDVMNGIFKHRGAMYQLGKRYFEYMYYERISSIDYRKVLQGMAARLDDWISKQDITKLSGVKESQVTNALNALKSRNIIIANDQKKGEYKLPTKSFAVWLKILGENAEEVLSENEDIDLPT